MINITKEPSDALKGEITEKFMEKMVDQNVQDELKKFQDT
jgi:uncharacterized membrane protein